MLRCSFYRSILISFYRLFLSQVPIAAACCLVIAQSLKAITPQLKREEQQQQEDDSENENTPAALAFDFPGAITLAVAISSLLAAIDLQNLLSWADPVVFGLVIVGIFFTLAFLVVETFPGNRELLMPLSLLKTEIGAFCAGQVLIYPHSLNILVEPELRRSLRFLLYFQLKNIYTDLGLCTSYY